MNNLVRFLKRFHFVLLFIVLEGAALALLVQNNRYQGGQIRRFYNEVTGGIFGEFNRLTDYLNLRENNIMLSAENARLRAQIAQSYNIFSRRVYTENDTVYQLQYDYVHAKIVSNSVNRRNNYLMINKGSNHGIEIGMAVISPNGVVGVVKLASPNFSSVLSLLHSDSQTPVRIKRTNFTGTVLWDGRKSDIVQMIHVVSHAEVQVGDTVITNSFSLAFPEGVLVGVVNKIQTKPNDEFNTLDVRLSTNFNTIDHVYVVKNLTRYEQEQLKRETEDNGQ